jgi:hypothetical protein
MGIVVDSSKLYVFTTPLTWLVLFIVKVVMLPAMLVATFWLYPTSIMLAPSVS